MSPLELLLFGALCYLFGLASGAVLIPSSWIGASSRSAGMSDEQPTASEHRWARQVSAVLLIAVVVVISWPTRRRVTPRAAAEGSGVLIDGPIGPPFAFGQTRPAGRESACSQTAARLTGARCGPTL